MAQIYPFQAIRPKKGLEHKIAALPYDVYSSAEARIEVLKEPMSFLKIDRSETQFEEEIDIYDDKVYQKAHDTLWEMIDKGEFVKEETECYYVYELIMDGRSQTGIVAKSGVDDYLNGVIKKHENTRADKELDRIRHVDICDAQTGPIFLAYRSKEAINEIVDRVKQSEPIYAFTSEDEVTHNVWIISAKDDIDTLKEQFEQMNDIYIADGHHRCASAVKVSLKRREAGLNSENKPMEYDHFLSVLFPDDQLMIMDYNRVVKDLNGHTSEAFIEEVSKVFEVEKISTDSYSQLESKEREAFLKPKNKAEISMFLDGQWYILKAKESILSKDPVEGLDVSLLQNHVLAPLLGIEDPKTDKRIDFVGGIRGIKELEKRVSSDCKVAFAMYPTSISELFDVADAGLLMPPKSTWFEPKLRSGLFIHSLS